MVEGPMTATEVQARMDDEVSKRASLGLDFSSALSDLARRARRALLRDALEYDADVLSQLAARWFMRLERLAGKMKVLGGESCG